MLYEFSKQKQVLEEKRSEAPAVYTLCQLYGSERWVIFTPQTLFQSSISSKSEKDKRDDETRADHVVSKAFRPENNHIVC